MTDESKFIIIFGAAIFVVMSISFVYVVQLLEQIRDRIPKE